MLDLQNIVFNEAIACEIQLQGKNTLIFCSVYRSPNSTEENDIGLHNLLYTLSTQAQGNLVITGDFNYPNIDWDLYRNLNDTMDKEFRFLEIVKDCFLFQHVNKPTRGRGTNIPSILDLVLTDEENLLDTLEHEAPLGKSDHAMLNIKIRCTGSEETSSITRWNYDKGNYEKMKEIFNTAINTHYLDQEQTVDDMWNKILELYNRAIEECIPRKKNKSRSWKGKVPLDRDALALIKRKDRLWKKCIRSRDEQAYTEYCRVRNKVRRLTRKAQSIYEKSVAKQAKTNPKNFGAMQQENQNTKLGYQTYQYLETLRVKI